GRWVAPRRVERRRSGLGACPATVGRVLWRSGAMRTGGDDAAEALALLGVRPRWDDQTRGVIGLGAIPLDELGRPRIDVALRISGFFRDAFPPVIAPLHDLVALLGSPDAAPASN